MSKKLQTGKVPTDVEDKGKSSQSRRPSCKERRRIGQNPDATADFLENIKGQESLKAGLMSGPIAIYLAPPIFASIFVISGVTSMVSSGGIPLKSSSNAPVVRPTLPSILVAFNNLFKAAGPLLPFALFILRVLFLICTQRAFLRGSSFFLRDFDRKVLKIFVLVTVVRVIIFLVCKRLRRELALENEIMSDHVLLGLSVTCLSRLELHAGLDLFAAFPGQRSPSRWLFLVVSAMAAAIILLVNCNNYVTARYFHFGLESMVGLTLGLVLFEFPMSCWLRYHAHPAPPARQDPAQPAHDGA